MWIHVDGGLAGMDDNDLVLLLGKLQERTENTEEDLRRLRDSQDQKHALLMEKLDSMQEQLDMYKFAIKLLKITGLTVVFILTFKFGSIVSLWESLKH